MEEFSKPIDVIDVIIEIHKDSKVKYEFEKDCNGKDRLRVDRILSCAMSYPGNYGFIPHTLADDNDALDVLVLCDEELLPGSVIKCRPIGYLEMSDEKGRDEKIIAVPTHDVDPSSDNIQCINDIPSIVRQKIKHFFSQYKNIDGTRWSLVEDYKDKKEAFELIEKYRQTYRENIEIF
jgi:inorganic pyrophosphatase